MGSGRAARLAKGLAGLALASMAIGVISGLAAVVGTESLLPYLIHLALVPFSAAAFAVLGALVASHRHRNPIGWLFLAASLFYGFETLSVAGSLVLTSGNNSSPSLAAQAMIWLSGWLWMPAIVLPTSYVFLLFPDGHLPSKRWRPVGWLVSGGIGGMILGILLDPGPMTGLGPDVANPFAISGLSPWSSWLSDFSQAALMLGLLGSTAAFFHRFRQAEGETRQQLKWLAYAGFLTLAAVVLSTILWVVAPESELALEVGTNLIGLAVLATAVAAAIAILQHRLYDINILINRTLEFSVLTASVAILYGIVVGASSALVRFNPQIPSLILTIIISLLLYRSARRALQSMVDDWTRRLAQRWRRSREDGGDDHLASTAVRPAPAWTSWPSFWQGTISAAWLVCAIAAVGVLLVAVPGYLAGIGQGPRDVSADISGAHSMLMGFDVFGRVASVASVLLSFALALLLFRRRKTHPMALYMAFYLLLFATFLSGPAEAAALALNIPQESVLRLEGLLATAPTVILLYLFPTGQFFPRWTKALGALSVTLAPLSLWLPAPTGYAMGDPAYWPYLGLFVGLAAAGFYAQWARYRATRSPLERQQVRLAMGGLVAWMAMVMLLSIPYVLRTQIPPNEPIPWWAPASEALWFFSFILPPATLALAVLRHRLWDIDVLINRTLVYGALTSGVVGLYVLSVGGLSLLFQANGGLLVSLVATGLVAVLFQPLRYRVQRGVNRLLYGERDDPYAVLSSLGRRLETSLAADDLLPTIVETVAETLKLPYTAVALTIGDQQRVVAAYGLPKAEVVELALNYQGEEIGRLVCGLRAPNEPFTNSEMTLLEDLGHQAGVVLHAVRLTEELRKSREQLVLAREEERRRLRRDLHDGLGPELASMTLKLDAARNLMARNPDGADQLLLDLKAQVQESLSSVRRLVYGLRPPALDELGLVPAVRESSAVRSAGTRPHISVIGPEPFPPLPAAVEVAAYRVALEAVTNVVRHASADTCRIRFSVTDELELEVVDDGSGLSPDLRAGVGLTSMRERALELGGSLSIGPGPGGGTRLQARFPLTLTES
jgi:signal transduction histidine kinase